MTGHPAPAATALPSRRTRRSRSARRWLVRRLLRDLYFTYTASIAPIALVVAILERNPRDVASALLLSIAFIGLQAILGLIPSSRRFLTDLGWSFLRLAVGLLYVAFLTDAVGGDVRPLAVLYLPVVVAAAAIGLRQGIVLGLLASAIFLAPEISDLGSSSAVALRGVGYAGVAVVLAMATRQLMRERRRAGRQLRSALVGERRRSRQIAAMEAVGRLVAAGGPDDVLLDRVLGVLVDRVGYRYVSIYLWDGEVLRRGSQRNYAAGTPEVIPATRGIVGRVASSRQLVYLPNVAEDPEYVAMHEGVVSEICAPLVIGDQLLGILNVESTSPLNHTDRDLIAVLADRVATVVALSADRKALAERGALFHNLHEFTEALSGSLELGQLCATIVEWTDRVVSADLVVVTTQDPATGRYLIRAAKGADASIAGTEVRPGEGLTGRAIHDRKMIVDEKFGPDSYPSTVSPDSVIVVRTGAGIPLQRGTDVLGAIAIARKDPEAHFQPLELEAMALLAGHASLAVANAFLHAEVEELAIRDALTGLHNRRYFDEALERLLAAHRRQPVGGARPLSVILFDLDHFGSFNKLHGHQVGDEVLRAFSEVLARRFRASDLVARFGGEEFVAVLDGATLEDAQRIAEEVRVQIAEREVGGDDAAPLQVTVSAGCATLDAENPTREVLLRTADVALFMAKRAGRNRVVAA
jgi:diguanylate cyclase (GGDEF)-like protein